MISGSAPVRAKKARYYEDHELAGRILPPPGSSPPKALSSRPVQTRAPDGWDGVIATPRAATDGRSRQRGDPA